MPKALVNEHKSCLAVTDQCCPRGASEVPSVNRASSGGPDIHRILIMRRSSRQHLRENAACKPGRSEEARQVVAASRLRREPGHRCGDKIGDFIGRLRVARRDIIMNEFFGAEVERASSVACTDVVATRAFEHKAPARRWIQRIATRSLLQHSRNGFGDGDVGAQNVRERDRFSFRPIIEHALVKAGFAAESGVKAGRIDAERVGDIGDADRVITAFMEKLLRSRHRRLGIEITRSAAGAGFICSNHYKIP